MTPRAELWAQGAVRLFGAVALLMLTVGLVGILLDRLFPEGHRWWEFWKPRPGDEEGASTEESEEEFGPGGHGDPDYLPTPGWSGYP